MCIATVLTRVVFKFFFHTFLLFFFFFFFFFNDTATTEIYTLSLHDALPIWLQLPPGLRCRTRLSYAWSSPSGRSEEHTSEHQSLAYLVCRLLLEKKKKKKTINNKPKNQHP